jgi:hypothetical protein
MMETNFRDRDEVWSSDDVKLGLARALHYRPPQDVSPGEQLYAAYLEVVNFELGDDLFIPTDFLDPRDEDTGRIYVKFPMKTIMQRTWWRAPEFAAKKLGREVRLHAVASGSVQSAGAD